MMMRKQDLDSFYYVPVSLDRIAKSNGLINLHYLGARFYYPIWYINHRLGGPGIGHPPLDLSRGKTQNSTP